MQVFEWKTLIVHVHWQHETKPLQFLCDYKNYKRKRWRWIQNDSFHFRVKSFKSKLVICTFSDEFCDWQIIVCKAHWGLTPSFKVCLGEPPADFISFPHLSAVVLPRLLVNSRAGDPLCSVLFLGKRAFSGWYLTLRSDELMQFSVKATKINVLGSCEVHHSHVEQVQLPQDAFPWFLFGSASLT